MTERKRLAGECVKYKEVHWNTVEGDMMHCIGLGGRHKPYTRHGRQFYRPWRNRYCASTSGDGYERWKVLEDKGYAERYDQTEISVMFRLTRAGLDWLGEQLNIKIHDERD